MPPMANWNHQDLEWGMETFLRLRWAKPNHAKVRHQVNVAPPGGWPDRNYRIPDLILVTAGNFDLNRGEYFEGAPDVAIEIYSPGDESYDKLDFYAELGVPAVWIIHRDTKEPEIFVLKRGRYRKIQPQANGWLRSLATGIELKKGKPGKLAMQLAGDDSTREDLPED